MKGVIAIEYRNNPRALVPDPVQQHGNIAAQLAIFIGFVAVVLWRMPAIIMDGGRFWAEEGLVYFSKTWDQPWYDAWFTIYAGYVNVAAGFGTWLALKLGGLSDAPMITVIFALSLQCFPVYVILTHAFAWRGSIVATAVAASSCALMPVMGEVWLNTITSQFHLALFSALIFAAPLPKTRLFLCDCAGLVLAVFSGPASCFLMPLFVLRAFRERKIQAILFAAIVFFGCCVQATIYLTHITPSRGGKLDLAELLSAISLHTIVLQFTGMHVALLFAAYCTRIHALARPLLAGPILFGLFYGIVGLAIIRAREIVLGRLFVAGIVITLVSFYEALGVSFAGFMNVVAGQRYAFIPDAANALLIIGLACASRGLPRYFFVAASAVLVLVGVANYRDGLGMFEQGAAWKPQVAAWQRDPTRGLTIWPGGWILKLPPHTAAPNP